MNLPEGPIRNMRAKECQQNSKGTPLARKVLSPVVTALISVSQGPFFSSSPLVPVDELKP